MPNMCTECGYEQTEKGCETPGCLSSIWMTDEVRQRRMQEAAEAADRQRINNIRARCMFSSPHNTRR